MRADDGIRTRDPHLGKVMRYQLRYVRMIFRSERNHSPPETAIANGAVPVTRGRERARMCR